MNNKKIWTILAVSLSLLLLVCSVDCRACDCDAQTMETIKKQNPQVYERMKTLQETQRKINQITKDFQAGKISYLAAKKQLSPLVEQQLKLRADNVDTEISQLEKRIGYLRDFKANFRKDLDKAVNVRLGEAQPDESTIF